MQKKKTKRSKKMREIKHHYFTSAYNAEVTKEKVEDFLKVRTEITCTLDELIKNESSMLFSMKAIGNLVIAAIRITLKTTSANIFSHYLLL